MLDRGEDAGSPEAADLARRWMAQVNKFSGGDPAMNAKSAAMWKDALSDEAVAPRLPFSTALWEFVAEANRRARETA